MFWRSVSLGILLCFVISGESLLQAGDFTNEDCMACHEDLEEETEQGSVRSLTVSAASFEVSVHGALEMSCVDCHTDIEDLPHEESLTPVDCGLCHSEAAEAFGRSIHASPAVRSGTGQEVFCKSCHGTHSIFSADDERSTIHADNIGETCTQCHEDQARKLGAGQQFPENSIQSFLLGTHGRNTLEEKGTRKAGCVDCHGSHEIQEVQSPESKLSHLNIVSTCGACHDDVVGEFLGSVHGKLIERGSPDGPVCSSCHNEHKILSPEEREPTVCKFRVAETCGKCHEDPEIVEKYNIPIKNLRSLYLEGVCGKALTTGENYHAAACQDCHGYHAVLASTDPASTVYPKNISRTCGGCHPKIRREYERSVHGKALESGVREAPVCSDCHGQHRILSHDDKRSPTYPIRMAKEICSRCHDSLVITEKYGLPTQRVSTYFESYHGLASQLGDMEVANCASCHGVHDILPSSDPESRIHPNHLMETCGKCHPAATEAFVTGLVHVSSKDPVNWVTFWVRRIYIGLILVTVASMLVHNLIILFHHLRLKYRAQKTALRFRRFPVIVLIQHALLATSFFVLVVSGFTLAFPRSSFAEVTTQYLFLGESQRRIVHRAAGVVMTVTMAIHLVLMFLTRRGRTELKYLLPRPADIRKAFQNILYHLGWTANRPRFDRFDYTEKIEYWALVWGTIVMVVTGLLMWFPTYAAEYLGLSRFWIEIATVVHYYEAWLATLAIVIWHFFFVIFHPHEYPMSLTWLTGELTREEMEEKHPEELNRILEKDETSLEDRGGVDPKMF